MSTAIFGQLVGFCRQTEEFCAEDRLLLPTFNQNVDIGGHTLYRGRCVGSQSFWGGG